MHFKLSVVAYVKINLDDFITRLMVLNIVILLAKVTFSGLVNVIPKLQYFWPTNNFYELSKTLYNMFSECISCLNVKSLKKL